MGSRSRPDISSYYVLALLNSGLLDWFVKQITTPFHSGWYAYNKQYIEQIPIKIPASAQEQRLADQIVERVPLIMASQTATARKPRRRPRQERWQREIEAHQQRIDALVCQLYRVDEIPG